MGTFRNLAWDVQNTVAEMLRAEIWFAQHRCDIVEQDSQQLAFLIKKSESQFDGPVVVVAVDDMRNNRDAVDVDVTISVTEIVTLNRERADFATAMEVAQACAEMLDGEDLHWVDIRQETPSNGVLTATAKFSGVFSR